MFVSLRVCAFVCVDACGPVFRVHARGPALHAQTGLCARSACVRVYVCSFACVRICVRVRGCATEACTTQGYSWAAPLVLAGYQGYSESSRGALDRAL